MGLSNRHTAPLDVTVSLLLNIFVYNILLRFRLQYAKWYVKLHKCMVPMPACNVSTKLDFFKKIKGMHCMETGCRNSLISFAYRLWSCRDRCRAGFIKLNVKIICSLVLFLKKIQMHLRFWLCAGKSNICCIYQIICYNTKWLPPFFFFSLHLQWLLQKEI